MKTRTYGTSSAITYPFLAVLLAAADFVKRGSISTSLVMFMFGLLVVLSWYGGHNNLVRVSATGIEVWNAYWRWWKKRQVGLNEIKSVFIDGGTRSAPISFKCVLNDGATFEFRSSLIGYAGAKKISRELSELGIEVETYRL